MKLDVCVHCGRASCASIEHAPFRCDDYDGSVEVIAPSALREQFRGRLDEWASIDDVEKEKKDER